MSFFNIITISFIYLEHRPRQKTKFQTIHRILYKIPHLEHLIQANKTLINSACYHKETLVCKAHIQLQHDTIACETHSSRVQIPKNVHRHRQCDGACKDWTPGGIHCCS